MLKIEKTFFHETLLKNHHFHADYLEIDWPDLVGQSWLKVNFSLQLDRNGRPVLTYANRPKIDPSTVLNFDIMDKLGTSLERAPLTSKTAKFESDLLKTNEDIASQRREILQTLVYGGGEKLAPHRHTNVCSFPQLCEAISWELLANKVASVCPVSRLNTTTSEYVPRPWRWAFSTTLS